MHRILVTDGEHRSALAIVRSLGRAGREVTVCSASERPLAAASRYAAAHRRVADPLARPAEYARDVLAIVEREGIDIVLPATDSSALPLLGVRDTGTFRLAFPEAGAYEAVSDKRRLMETARSLGVATPAQTVLERRESDRTGAIAFASERGFDVVLKPSRSARVSEGTGHRFSVTLVRSAGELQTALDAYPPEAYPLLLQERVRGPGLGVFLLTHSGETIACFAHRRIREKPPTGGVSVYRESVGVRDDLRRSAEAILGHYSWTGVAMVEFKEDARTGTPYLMEVNGRFWGSLQLAVDAGVDFPELLVRMMAGESVAPVTSYRTGVRSRWLWGEADYLVWVLKHGRAYRDAFPEIPSPLSALARFVVPWMPRDRWEVLRPSDPLPFARETVEWIRAAFARR